MRDSTSNANHVKVRLEGEHRTLPLLHYLCFQVLWSVFYRRIVPRGQISVMPCDGRSDR